MACTTHGRPAAYKAGCRCDACRDANRIYQAAANKRRSNNPAAADRAGHGKQSTYTNYLCRCDECREANTAASRLYRERRKERAA